MPIKTILWPTDLSTHSKKALVQVVSLSQKYNAKVIVLYTSVDLCSYFPAYGNYPSQDRLNNFRDWEVEKARATLNDICDNELKSCPALVIRLAQGDPAETILEFANKEKADLIIMSSHGLGFEKRGGTPKSIGSVTDKVIKNSSVPVQIVPLD
ncbi:Nucleotide-binding universal stress protein, UspA family [Maridesulfovibrio ferrireducens]|uniref:Nucleotide-binding universal stress protein, UspA family n=1 Tax=Maridesulfovibrio ferrireducens TaxID=246191 RepID=A0A1G9HPN6_9BACT|nr:universal stress protein [Maridesulfovibrio ferrireducens]SDL14941.1 Nucleotide-binding universal stress protein, UspA family [Maridesulfovibrio ferrireducens]